MEAGSSPPDEELGRIFTPPGLELSDAANTIRAAALEKVEDSLRRMGDTAKQSIVIEALRQAVLKDVDAKMAQRAEEIWTQGKQMLGQIQQKHRETTTRLTDEVARCRDRQLALEAENGQLKQAIQQLSSRFPPLLGSPAGGEEAATGTTSSGLLTPGSGDGLASPAPTAPDEAAGAGGGAKLPEVPEFPFPAQPAPAAPLSLAEALGSQTPHRTPLSLANSLTPSQTPEAAAAAPARSAGCTFSLTLRKADGADLGLSVSHHKCDRVLRVDGVRADGAVEAWNRQCAGGACAEKAVLKGDRIVSVNNVAYDPERMLEECREKHLLRLTVIRGDTATSAGTPGRHGGLRADASVFVPTAADEQKLRDLLPAAQTSEAAER
eukprot:CAMPEP_0204596312 /NCGR_PEP_ID=MMETSP0661-20131031/53168_1 /ASSEMBLY_ACC=CAM_ASM_000606 /TAXON_ID=109239 /ORGANISM="Alexandrium margalefi, Strain AMGDE01CS-322" /LENGTH=379 /DNA_ID=CAMNT_0051606909 /DNA_START=24 /DNA_END=1163 /DNA_ORIENTATION=+